MPQRNDMRILIFGASGYLGQAIVAELKKNSSYKILANKSRRAIDEEIDCVNIDWNDESSIACAFSEVDVIAHLASQPHGRSIKSSGAFGSKESIIDLTKKILRYGEKYRVNKIVYASSIAVYSPNTTLIDSSTLPCPSDWYGEEKYECEKIIENSSLESIILRLAMIYGPNAPGTPTVFSGLIKKRVPLPIVGFKNKRNFLAIDKAVKEFCGAIGPGVYEHGVHLVCDDFRLSPEELAIIIGGYANTKPIVFNIPPFLIRVLLALVGQKKKADLLSRDFKIYR